MEGTPKDILSQAREAFHSKNYADSLERYEYFFDHALDDDPHSFYGVRLSYCLSEWNRLGEVFPPALRRLKAKADQSLALLTRTKNPENFHDFVSICEHLKRHEDAISTFLEIHSADRGLAASIVRFVWDELVQRKLWTICAVYLSDLKENYDRALTKFDESMAISNEEPSFGGKQFEDQIKSWYVRDLTNILLVLRNTERGEAAALLSAQVNTDM